MLASGPTCPSSYCLIQPEEEVLNAQQAFSQVGIDRLQAGNQTGRSCPEAAHPRDEKRMSQRCAEKAQHHQPAGLPLGDDGSIAAALDRLREGPAPQPVPLERLAPYDRRRLAAGLAALLDGLTAQPTR